MNIYWPVYKNIEKEFQKLMYDIYIDDKQLSVYSTKITELILRVAIEIESISKSLYLLNGGTKKREKIRYDYDALELLNNLWNLEAKVVIISSTNCFLSDTFKVIKPFIKDVKKSAKNEMTYQWNNAYQNIKHDRENSIDKGNIGNLFNILAALFVLNLYYKDEIYFLGNDSSGNSVDFGSDIFSVKVSGNGAKFEESVYNIQRTEWSKSQLQRINEQQNIEMNKLIFPHPKFIKYLSLRKNPIPPTKEEVEKIFSKEEWNNLEQDSINKVQISNNVLQYEAILNKRRSNI